MDKVNSAKLDTPRLLQLKEDGVPFILLLNRAPIAVLFRYPLSERDLLTMKLHVKIEEGMVDKHGESI